MDFKSVAVLASCAILFGGGCGDATPGGGGDVTAPADLGVAVDAPPATDLTAVDTAVAPQDQLAADSSLPDQGAPDLALPDFTTPDLALPDSTAPDSTLPDLAATDLALPDFSLPDFSQPDLVMVDLLPALDLSPTCTDKIKNGNETDVDCGGGTCPACALGQGCIKASDCGTSSCAGGKCNNGSSCADLLKQNGALSSGNYTIDPDGSGPFPPLAVYCDMSKGFTFKTGGEVQNDYTSISGGCSGGLQAFQVHSAAHAAALKKFATMTSSNDTWYYSNFFAGPIRDCGGGLSTKAGYLKDINTWVSANLVESTLAPLDFSQNCNNANVWDPIPLNDKMGYADRGAPTVLYNSTETVQKGNAVCSVNDVP